MEDILVPIAFFCDYPRNRLVGESLPLQNPRAACRDGKKSGCQWATD